MFRVTQRYTGLAAPSSGITLDERWAWTTGDEREAREASTRQLAWGILSGGQREYKLGESNILTCFMLQKPGYW